MENNFNFSYEILSVDVEQGTLVVKFTPESANLSPVQLNTYLQPKLYTQIVDANNQPLFASQDEVPFSYHIENTVNNIKPVQQWQNQYLIQSYIDNLTTANGSFTFSNNVTTVYPGNYVLQINPLPVPNTSPIITPTK